MSCQRIGFSGMTQVIVLSYMEEVAMKMEAAGYILRDDGLDAGTIAIMGYRFLEFFVIRVHVFYVHKVLGPEDFNSGLLHRFVWLLDAQQSVGVVRTCLSDLLESLCSSSKENKNCERNQLWNASADIIRTTFIQARYQSAKCG